MKKGGTRIRVRLNEEYRLENLSGRDFQGNTPDFALTLAGLCPALDVDLYLQQSAKMVEKLVTANDWVEMPIFDLLSRIADGAKREDFSEELETYLPLFEVIRNEAGIPIGRVCIIPDQDRYNFSNGKRGGYMIGAVTVGGFYTSALSELCGVLVGVTSRAARDECSPIASLEQIRPFATRQALTLARARSDNSYTLSNCASAVLALGGDARPLPIAECVDGYLRFNDIVARFSSLENNEVVIADYHIFLQYSSKKKAIVFMANVLFLETDRTIFVHHGRGTFSQDGWPWPEQAMDDKFHTWSCYRLCVEALAQSWNVSAKDLYAARESYQTRSDKGVLIGMVGKKKIMEELVSVFRRPK